ncbi:ribosomal protein S5 domain 2-like protein [Hymenopellis radicata]|nr:ribosomal protein S5 domain 2-like protein [Hymenopellis radicata]
MTISELVQEARSRPDGEAATAVVSELEGRRTARQAGNADLFAVLESIYGTESIGTWQPDANRAHHDGTLRYQVSLSFPSPHDDVSIKVLVSLPPSYPASSPPQLQLLSRYIGSYGADSVLFGSVLKTYISVNGVEWSPDQVCVFDGLQNVLDRCTEWYEDHLNADQAGKLVREDEKEQHNTLVSHTVAQAPCAQTPQPSISQPVPLPDALSLLAGIHIFEAQAITDRKSAFVGRACAITDPVQVPIILSHLSADRRISRAAHPIINAWRYNDDDGETAAGGRLAHLLQILEVNNVLVIVTRYFGGIHLGPDRFKHINQAARNALELGGFLDSPDVSKKSRGRKH